MAMAIGKPNCDGTTHPNGTRAIRRSDWLDIARWSILVTPWIGSCSRIEDELIGNTAWIVTFLSSLALFYLGGGFLVRSLYTKQLKNWDLERNPTTPSLSHSNIVLIASSVVIWMLFIFFQLSISMPSDQHWKNILGWLFGSVLGGILAYRHGRSLAVNRYRRSCQDAQLDAKRRL